MKKIVYSSSPTGEIFDYEMLDLLQKITEEELYTQEYVEEVRASAFWRGVGYTFIFALCAKIIILLIV